MWTKFNITPIQRSSTEREKNKDPDEKNVKGYEQAR